MARENGRLLTTALAFDFFMRALWEGVDEEIFLPSPINSSAWVHIQNFGGRIRAGDKPKTDIEDGHVYVPVSFPDGSVAEISEDGSATFVPD